MIRPKKSGVWPSSEEELELDLLRVLDDEDQRDDPDGDGGVDAPGAVLLLAAEPGCDGVDSAIRSPTLTTLRHKRRTTRDAGRPSVGAMGRRGAVAERSEPARRRPSTSAAVLLRRRAAREACSPSPAPACRAAALARAVAAKLVCAVDGGDACERPGATVSAAPSPLERRVRRRARRDDRAEHVPDDLVRGRRLRLPPGRLPRVPRAQPAPTRSGTARSSTPRPACAPAAFVHVVDCRERGRRGAGRLRLLRRARRQRLPPVLALLPGSWTRASPALGGFHADDWESYQVRIARTARPGAGPAPTTATTVAAAGSPASAATLGWAPEAGWDAVLGAAPRRRRQPRRHDRRPARRQPPDRAAATCALIPLEPIAAGRRARRRSPSRRRGRRRSGADPEATGT